MSQIRQTDRAFGLTFAAIFGLISAVGWFVFHVQIYWAMAVSAVFLILALAVPLALFPLNRLWSWFGYRLSHVSNFLLLGVFFYLIILPFGLILRLLGCDPMHRAFDIKSNSYWTSVNRHTNAETFRDMF